jgi:hypothetical protein
MVSKSLVAGILQNILKPEKFQTYSIAKNCTHRGGDIAQWYSTFLSCTRSWVQYQGLQESKNKQSPSSKKKKKPCAQGGLWASA